MPKAILAGGGTGGHVYPALAMGAALQAHGFDLVYYGDPDRLEGRVVPERGIPFRAIPAVQYPRAGFAQKVRFASGLGAAILTCRTMLREDGADVVLGVGGYISAPPVLAASTLGIPRAIHEANVTPGMANRLCARVADLVFLAYAETAGRLPGSARREVVGCPVNVASLRADRREAAARYGLDPDAPTLLIVGGSLGAETINRFAMAIVDRAGRTHQCLWVTGPKYHDPVRARLDGDRPGVVVVGYEDRMRDAYAVADLVLCRAGSSTLAELTALGKPSVLVPSPNVTENHQEGNARGLEKEGAALVFVEADTEPDAVAGEVSALLADSKRLEAMGTAALRLGRTDTAERVAELVAGLVR